MSAIVQVLSFIYSFAYGLLFCFVGVLFRRCITGKIINLIFNVLYSIFFSIIYMYILYKINYGILHEYFVLMFLCGYLICRVKICKYIK